MRVLGIVVMVAGALLVILGLAEEYSTSTNNTLLYMGTLVGLVGVAVTAYAIHLEKKQKQ